MANFTAGTSFTDGVTNDVTAAKLNALIADAVPTSNLSLNSTTGTISNFTASTANITLGTIPTLTAGTTTSTAATITSATITTGTIPTLVATTLVTTGTGTAAAPAIVPTGDTNTGLFFPAADTIAFSEGGTEAMRIDSSGNVGVGTTSPTAQVTIGKAVNSATLPSTSANHSISLYPPTTTGYYGGGISWSEGTNTAASICAVDDGASGALGLVLSTGNNLAITERLRIDSSGILLVAKNTANLGTVGYRFDTTGEMYTSANSSTNSLVTYAAYSTSASAYRFYVGMAGTVFATNTTISAISDIRYKENIRDLNVGLESIMALRPRVFDWKDGKGKNIKNDRGFIAQEFEQVFPDLIDEWKDDAPQGEEPYKAVRQDLIPVLVKAIQELKAKNDILESKVAALEAA